MSQNHEFLEGIDEQFQQQMKLFGNGNGKSSRSGSRSRYHGVTRQIADLVDRLPTSQKEEVLEFIYSIRPKAD
jgi:hypothetical protein